MTLKNNWGSWLNSEIASPGVISCNRINWEYIDNEICTICEEFYKQVEKMVSCPDCGGELREDGECDNECGWSKDYGIDGWECFDHQKLIGDWKKNSEGLYEPDVNGEFAAEISSSSFNDITVIWSKFTTRGTPCSPCAPSCVSIPDENETGEFLCYTLPDYLIYKEE